MWHLEFGFLEGTAIFKVKSLTRQEQDACWATNQNIFYSSFLCSCVGDANCEPMVTYLAKKSTRVVSRVARFFLVQHTKEEKIFPITIKYPYYSEVDKRA
jgi:hypothetical protein